MYDQQHSKMTNITLTGSPGQDCIRDDECVCTPMSQRPLNVASEMVQKFD